MLEGRLVKAKGGFYFVNIGNGETLRCRARGKLKDEGQDLVVGDRVEVSHPSQGEPVIEAVCARENYLKRPPVANVDQVITLISVAEPPMDLALLSRMIVCAEAAGLDIVVCLNKIDLADQKTLDTIEEVKSVFQDCCFYTVLQSSILSGQGINQIRQVLDGKTTVLAGPSGAGKSTLINQILPEAQLRVAPVSKKSKKGRHTTRFVELLPWGEGGFVVDTPGFQRLNLDGISTRQLHFFFPDLFPYADECRFEDCCHDAEPNCNVKDAVAAGRIASWRYDQYLHMLNELKQKERQY